MIEFLSSLLDKPLPDCAKNIVAFILLIGIVLGYPRVRR